MPGAFVMRCQAALRLPKMSFTKLAVAAPTATTVGPGCGTMIIYRGV